MYGTRRTFTPIILAQVALALVVGISMGFASWRASETHRTQIEIPEQTVQTIQAQAHQAVLAPYVFSATADPSSRERNHQSMAEARAGLGVLESLRAISPKLAAQTGAALDTVDAAVTYYWEAEAGKNQQAALEELTIASRGLTNSLSTIQSTYDVETRSHHKQTIVTLLALGSVLIFGFISIAVVGQRYLIRKDDEDRDHLELTVDGLATTLQRAANGESISNIPDHPALQELCDAIRIAVGTLDELRSSTARIRHRSSFTYQLVDALNLSETEEEVVRTASRAAHIAFPNTGFQMLLAPPGKEVFSPCDPDTHAPCTLTNGQSCPAIRKARTLYHGPDTGLSRCPRLSDESSQVTCTPLTVSGQPIGVVQLSGQQPDDGQIEDLESLAISLGARLGVVRNLAEQKLEAGTDALTELPNRRTLNEHLQRLDLTELPYAMVALDLDHFKQLNDTHGHEVGDQCLQVFADVLREACRGTDLPCRMGGEEFLVLLPGVDADAGMAVAKRIQAYLREAVKRNRISFTTSMGVAARPEHGTRAEDVLRVADQALYQAKESGRNRIVRANSTPALECVG